MTTGETPKRKFFARKIKFVDRRQQTRFAIEMMVLMILFPLLFYILVILPPFNKVLLGKNAEVLSMLFLNQLNMIRSVWWVVVFVLVYVAILSVLMSHKIFGPIYRLSRAIEAKLNGEKDIYCRLRKGDYFIEFASLLGKLIESDKVSSEKQSHDSDSSHRS